MALLRVVIALLCVWGACAAQADSFGRFGYRPLAHLPGFSVSSTGIQVAGGMSLEFSRASKAFRPVETSATSQTVRLDGGSGSPSDVRFSLIGDSLDLRFEDGLSLGLSGAEAPFLSWKDGSAGPEVATPKVSWLLLSYSTPHPPLVLGFAGNEFSFKVTGKPGSWRLESPNFIGWLRIMLPLGDRKAATPDAATLGVLSNSVALDASHWSAVTPKVKNVVVTTDDLGLDAEWTFDGPGAVIPPAVTLAQLGGYPISVRSPYHELSGSSGLGPLDFVDGETLSIHFPARRVRPGRALGLGPATENPIGSASPSDIPSVVDLALESLLGHRDAALAKLADDTSAHYLEDAPYTVEPLTRQQMPFEADGAAADLAAAHALLMQATSDAVNSADPNSLLDSLGFDRDWWTWKIFAADAVVGRRATALAALAGALSQNGGSRLLGATLEAGLEADEGWRVWRRRFEGAEPNLSLIQPLRELRQSFFALKGASPSPFFEFLQSPLRVGVGSGLELEPRNGGLDLQWPAEDTKPSVITFFGEAPAFKELVNIRRITIEPAKGYVSMYYVPLAAGPCSVSLALSRPLPIPAQVSPPDYSE